MGEKSNAVKATSQSQAPTPKQVQQSGSSVANSNPSHSAGQVSASSTSAPVQLMKFDTTTATEYLEKGTGVADDTKIQSSGSSGGHMSRSSQGSVNKSDYHKTFTRARAHSAIAHGAKAGSDEALEHGHLAHREYRSEKTDRGRKGADGSHKAPFEAASADASRHQAASEAWVKKLEEKKKKEAEELAEKQRKAKEEERKEKRRQENERRKKEQEEKDAAAAAALANPKPEEPSTSLTGGDKKRARAAYKTALEEWSKRNPGK